jgi:hypothetical protein
MLNERWKMNDERWMIKIYCMLMIRFIINIYCVMNERWMKDERKMNERWMIKIYCMLMIRFMIRFIVWWMKDERLRFIDDKIYDQYLLCDEWKMKDEWWKIDLDLLYVEWKMKDERLMIKIYCMLMIKINDQNLLCDEWKMKEWWMNNIYCVLMIRFMI